MLGDNFVNRRISVKDVNLPEYGMAIYNFMGRDVPTLRFNNAVAIMHNSGYWACTIWFTNLKLGEMTELEYVSNLYSTYQDQVGFVASIIKEWIIQNDYDLDSNDISGENWFASFMIHRLTAKEIEEFKSYDIVFEDAEGVEEIYVDFHIPRAREIPHLRILNTKPDYAKCYNHGTKKLKKAKK